MAKHKYLVRALCICAVALLCGFMLLPAFTHVSAASDDGFPSLRAYLPMYIEWKALNNAQTDYCDYERDLLSTFLLGEQHNYFYGSLVDGSNGVLGAIVSNDISDDGIFEAEFTSSQRVGSYTLRLASPVFVPLDYDVMPSFSLCMPEDNSVISWRIAGYEVVRTTNDAYTQIEQEYKPFAYQATTELPEGTWFNLVMPTDFSPTDGSKGYWITQIRIVVADDDEGTLGLGNLQYKTSYFPLNDAAYIDQVALMNVLGFTAQLPSEINVDFTSWITTAISSFWTFEIVPGFSIGGVISGLLGVALLVAFLKYFAGG